MAPTRLGVTFTWRVKTVWFRVTNDSFRHKCFQNIFSKKEGAKCTKNCAKRREKSFPLSGWLSQGTLLFNPTCSWEQHPRHTRMTIRFVGTHWPTVTSSNRTLATWLYSTRTRWSQSTHAKCTTLHLGKKTSDRVHHHGNLALGPVISQVDLSVVVFDDLKWDLQTTASGLSPRGLTPRGTVFHRA